MRISCPLTETVSREPRRKLRHPTAGETRFVAYRTDLFEKYGKTASKTMEVFLELANFFNGKEDGLYGVSMRAQRGIHFASGWMSLMYNFGGGSSTSRPSGQTVWLLPQMRPKRLSLLQFFVDLLKCARRRWVPIPMRNLWALSWRANVPCGLTQPLWLIR